MKLAVVIPTYGRKPLLRRLLSYLEQQSRLPDIVVVSAPDFDPRRLDKVEALQGGPYFWKAGFLRPAQPSTRMGASRLRHCRILRR